MKTWAVGDIHGCYKELNDLLGIIYLKDWDKIVFIGDYIDRGPDSKKVIDLIMFMEEEFGKDNIIALKGNHEDMCLHANRMYEYNDRSLGSAWRQNGMQDTLNSFDGEIPKIYLDWMLSLPNMYEDEKAYYVHAGFYPELDPDRQIAYDMLWIRNEFILSGHDWGKPVIHGHTAFKEVQIKSNRISIDTGCVYGEKLSAYCVETGEVISIKKL